MSTTSCQEWIDQLRSDDSATRLAAAERLATLADSAQPAAVPLVEALARDEHQLSDWAVAALEGLGPPASADIRPLIQLLDRDHELVQYWSATLLGRAGSEASAATDALSTVANDSRHSAARRRARWALDKIVGNK